ncbi:transcriptional regulator with XRE-family HTH domain [Hymenobacter luteus]|uniref:Transcriptional regulator with XRE-family HTH domain n=2 Tax=Hymenobacter TaxID=89966 RepID=A0A7W9WBH4_9BACT|nr:MULTISPECIES: helix-turn-helix transcriptional regulator [Hymenobacter]MBB4601727.1 transcriptional regulator with XRE-family HTH domain [Hymenobacter latericoloratus]MBB6059844.1 transcriptional regulator with XRE-family HTH domain [Hymenobacter luteus]
MIEQRIKELLLARQLSPTQFADTIGISRPIVSHILSGRNKPSLEVVQRTIAAFPELSLSWLLNGVGPMVAAAAQGAEEPPRSRPVRPRNEGTHQPKQTEASEALKPEEAPAPTAPTPPAIPPTIENTEAKRAETTPTAPSNVAGLTTQAETAQVVAVPEKTIRRIVIFYQDGTFSDFRPEQ